MKTQRTIRIYSLVETTARAEAHPVRSTRMEIVGLALTVLALVVLAVSLASCGGVAPAGLTRFEIVADTQGLIE